MKRRDGNPGKRAIGEPVNVGRRLVADPGQEVDEFTSTELAEIEEPAGPPTWIPPLPESLALTDELEDDEQARKLWTKLCELLIGAGILTEGDLFALEQFVMATLEARRAYFQLRTEGSTVETVNPGGGRASRTTHPAYRVWRDANSMMLKWGEHLGLTPVARTRLGLALGKTRKLVQELGDLPDNPLSRDEGAQTIDVYGEEQ